MALATQLSPSLLRRWKQKYLDKGKEGLKDSYPRVDPQLRALEEENERLKRIVAKQAIELERGRPAVKSELLKKLLSDSGKDSYYVSLPTICNTEGALPVVRATS